MEVIKTRRDTDHGDLPTESVAYFMSGIDFQAALEAAGISLEDIYVFQRITDKSEYPGNTFFTVSESGSPLIECGWGDGDHILYWYSAADRVYLNETPVGMFRNFEECWSIDLSGVSTGNARDFYSMFSCCYCLETLDISSFSTLGLFATPLAPGGMSFMFEACYRLRTIYASDLFAVPEGSDTDYMFDGCTSLVGGNGTQYSSAYTDGEYARIDRTGAPGYFTYRAAP